MANTKDKGNTAEAAVLSDLIRSGYTVLMPFGDNARYDLVTERNGQYTRIQCKTVRVAGGSLCFEAASNYGHRGRKSRDYRGDADVFAAYSPETGEIYYVPVMEVGRTRGTLRISAPKNGQVRGVRHAKDFTHFPG